MNEPPSRTSGSSQDFARAFMLRNDTELNIRTSRRCIQEARQLISKVDAILERDRRFGLGTIVDRVEDQ